MNDRLKFRNENIITYQVYHVNTAVKMQYFRKNLSFFANSGITICSSISCRFNSKFVQTVISTAAAHNSQQVLFGSVPNCNNIGLLSKLDLATCASSAIFVIPSASQIVLTFEYDTLDLVHFNSVYRKWLSKQNCSLNPSRYSMPQQSIIEELSQLEPKFDPKTSATLRMTQSSKPFWEYDSLYAQSSSISLRIILLALSAIRKSICAFYGLKNS